MALLPTAHQWVAAGDKAFLLVPTDVFRSQDLGVLK